MDSVTHNPIIRMREREREREAGIYMERGRDRLTTSQQASKPASQTGRMTAREREREME